MMAEDGLEVAHEGAPELAIVAEATAGLKRLRRNAQLGVAGLAGLAAVGVAIVFQAEPDGGPALVIVPAFACLGIWLVTLLAGRRIKTMLLEPLAAAHGLTYEAHPVGIFNDYPDHLLPRYSEGAGGRAWDRFGGRLAGLEFQFAEVQKRKMNSNFRGYVLRCGGFGHLPKFMVADERLITSFGIERAPDRMNDLSRVDSRKSVSGRTIGVWLGDGEAVTPELDACIGAMIGLEPMFGQDCRFYNAVNAKNGLFVALDCSRDLFEVGGVFTAWHLFAENLHRSVEELELAIGAGMRLICVSPSAIPPPAA